MFLTDTVLFYKHKEDETILGFFPIHRIKVSFYKSISGKDKPVSGEDLCFILTHDTKLEMLFSQNTQAFLNTQQVMKSKMVLTDFGLNYKIEGILNTGSFSKLLVATKIDPDRSPRQVSEVKKYAIKSFNRQIMENSEKYLTLKESLIKEIEVLNRVKHPCVIELFEVYEGANHIYLVMEFLEGGNL